MSKNPFVNALVASGYIGLIVTFIFYAQTFSDSELGLMAPMLFLSLFVFSAALMGYLLLSEPLQLFLENKKEEATKLFLMTIVSFAGITAAIISVWFIFSAVL